MKKMLEAAGYHVIAFTNAYDLLKKLDEHIPHLVISDINMPVMSGFELHEKMKVIPDCREVPLIFVTSDIEIGTENKAERSGAAGYVTKPLAKSSFLNMVAESC